MKLLPIVLAVAGVVALFFVGFVVTDALHRMRRKSARAVDRLERRKLSRTEEIPTALKPAAALERLTAAFAGRSPILPHRTERELIMFWGTAGGLAQFRGIAGMRPQEMPVRLAAQVRDGATRVLIDEDFGFHLFFGPARGIFDRLYEQALNEALAKAREALRTT